MHARRTVVLQLYSLISVNIFWYFMHMRGKTICEFTVIIEYACWDAAFIVHCCIYRPLLHKSKNS